MLRLCRLRRWLSRVRGAPGFPAGSPQGHMAAEEEAYDEKDKGPLVYQESKVFNGETFLINVYDHTKRRAVTFETYGLESQDQLHIQYSYQDFDGLFRFNAELMNPNRKEGRFHWISERLAILIVGKDRQLKLQPEPTSEVPELPIYETVRKIPTGRMDLKERQRLREQMDMLDIKRNENIHKRKQESRQRFLQHVFWLKEESERMKREHHEKLEAERTRRVQMKEELERRNKEADRLEKERQRQRRIAVEAKEERVEERDAEEYRQLRARWKMRDAEKAKAIQEAIQRKEKDLAELRAKRAQERKHEGEIMQKREGAWSVREERIRRKNHMWLKAVLEVKAERLRMAKMMQERNQEYLNLLHSLRQPIFEAQLKRMEERKQAAEAIAQSTAEYHEKRAVPKKVKKKGKNALKDEAAKEKRGGKKEEGKEGKEGKSDTDKLLDAVEAKMRAEMEEQQRRAKFERLRDKRIKELQEARVQKCNAHMAEVREAYRKKKFEEEQKANQRRLVQKEKEAEIQAAADKKKQELERLQRLREQNIARKEKERLAALAAMAA
ncbi:unnamed protein product [Durusdinium trenchii]|uniref:Uncharacterized protein n=2 Tax=Durusdinium trenchii TaxID=1381693 RepID=A0ABP0L6K1_9DINO